MIDIPADIIIYLTDYIQLHQYVKMMRLCKRYYQILVNIKNLDNFIYKYINRRAYYRGLSNVALYNKHHVSIEDGEPIIDMVDYRFLRMIHKYKYDGKPITYYAYNHPEAKPYKCCSHKNCNNLDCLKLSPNSNVIYCDKDYFEFAKKNTTDEEKAAFYKPFYNIYKIIDELYDAVSFRIDIKQLSQQLAMIDNYIYLTRVHGVRCSQIVLNNKKTIERIIRINPNLLTT